LRALASGTQPARYAIDTQKRNTKQRQAIVRAFLESDRPLSPMDVLELSQPHSPRLGIATVYRSIKDLTEAGWLTSVDVPGGPSRFERSGKGHHHHFQCRGCGRVFEVEDCAPDGILELAPPGFEVDDHELWLYGRCPECAD
jgi:Fur family ferric uptake transcriptional regulator